MMRSDDPLSDRDGGRGLPAMAIALGTLVVLGATAGMLRRAEPFVTWYYLFAWYGTLVALDGFAALTGAADRHGRRFLLLERPRHAATLLAWSVVTWLFFEFLNFRLQNWYYVFVPDRPAVRWTAIVFSFATVFPAIFIAEVVLDNLNVARRVRWPRIRWTPGRLWAVRGVGAAMLALPLLWPRWFFPLVWGGVTLLVEPVTYRREADRSLLGDLERGRPGRILRLLLAGAFAGLLWELYNSGARSKWIYTVPGLEELKLFEMPVLGFFGFPPFALECFVAWQALVTGGMAVDRAGRARPAPRSARIGAALAAVTFSTLILLGMERRTISSYSPRLSDLPNVPAERLRATSHDVFTLAAADPSSLAAAADAPEDRARDWIETARLATLRGIGTANARRLRRAGVASIETLAAEDPDRLAERLRAADGAWVVPARVRVWVRAAREEMRRRQ